MKASYTAFVLATILLCATGSDALHGEQETGASSHQGPAAMVPEHGIYYLEIVTPDSEAVRDFYGQAYGWEFSEATPELGNAYYASMPGGSLIGIRAPLRDDEDPIVRTYLRVNDLQSAVQKARELGATIAIESMEIAGQGTIAIYLLGGIEQGIWQAP